MTKKEKKQKKVGKVILKLIIVCVFLVSIIGIFYIAKKNYIMDDIKDKTNLIINNNNVTKDLKAEVLVQEGVVYVSKADIYNYFDNTITYEEQYQQILTSSEKKLASLPIGQTQIEVNSAKVKIKGAVFQKEEHYYLPISELGDVYNIKTTYNEETGVVTVDSLDRAYSIATAKKNVSIKYKPTGISRTVAKVKQGETVIIANRSDYPVPEGWTRVRTQSGILGYVKSDKLGEKNQIREAIEKKAKIEGPVSLVWDYYSEYGTAPNREETNIKGVNVVSPTFFRVEQAGKGKLNEYVGNAGKKYITWAKEKGYQIWPSLSNEGLNDTTSEILRDYKNREKMINQIVDYVVKYQLDGINIDFENMYEADKDYFTRFLMELKPRLNEIGAVLTVDVTAPDGSPNWSLCYDRFRIAKTVDYIIFMGYDQYGSSSDKMGTTAGYDWVEVNIEKFLGQEAVPAEKLILGLPFYTRVWWTKANGKVDSDTVAMKNIDKVVPSNSTKTWEENLKQYKVEYTKNGTKYTIWLEEETSFAAKLDLVQKYQLAGAAYWVKDMEPESLWKVISEKLGV